MHFHQNENDTCASYLKAYSDLCIFFSFHSLLIGTFSFSKYLVGAILILFFMYMLYYI